MALFVRTDVINEITDELARIAIKLKLDTKANTIVENVRAETFFCDLFNIIYDLNLKNLNNEDTNAPSIDLGDEKAGVSYQITSTNTKDKVLDCTSKFQKYDWDKKFKILNIFIIGEKKKYYKLPKFETFELNVIDIVDIGKEIEKLSLDKLKLINEYMKKELKFEYNSYKPVFHEREHYFGLTFMLTGLYRKRINSKVVDANINEFGNILSRINPRARELMYAILLNSSMGDKNNDLVYTFDEIQKDLKWDDELLLREFDVLVKFHFTRPMSGVEEMTGAHNGYNVGIGSQHINIIEEYAKGEPMILECTHFKSLGINFFTSVLKYVFVKSGNEKYKSELQKIFIDLDFTILN